MISLLPSFWPYLQSFSSSVSVSSRMDANSEDPRITKGYNSHACVLYVHSGNREATYLYG